MGKSKRGKTRAEPKEPTLHQLREQMLFINNRILNADIESGASEKKGASPLDHKKINQQLEKIKRQMHEITSKMSLSLSDIEREQEFALEEVRKALGETLRVRKGCQVKDIKIEIVDAGWTVETIKNPKKVTFAPDPEIIELLSDSETKLDNMLRTIEEEKIACSKRSERDSTPDIGVTKSVKSRGMLHAVCILCGTPYEISELKERTHCKACDVKKND
jgi:hypothetical protein